ncbi:MAG: hypothetical protein BGO52_03700 [Sphingobacteriales bacterium 44-61]|nr:MAG: hypothetical protein BGO52_03700 [Sphingobacteriales bacterium 44-61]
MITINRKSKRPTRHEVDIYFNQRGMPGSEALKFFQFHESVKWQNKNGLYIAKWKSFAYRWIAAVIRTRPSLFNRKIH